MTRIHTTGRDAWNNPRSPYNDAQRQWAFGPVQPMERRPSNAARPRMWFCVFAGSAVLWALLLLWVVT